MSDLFYLYITKHACMRLVFYCSIYGTVPRAHNGTLRFFFFFLEEAENREWESTKALYQANNP